MKKGGSIMLIICALSLTMVIGIFVGRNINSGYAYLPMNTNKTDGLPAVVTTDFRLDINSATKVQLMELPGIGDKIAERIVIYRTQNGKFESTEELLNVEGIGEKKLAEIEALIRVGG